MWQTIVGLGLLVVHHLAEEEVEAAEAEAEAEEEEEMLDRQHFRERVKGTRGSESVVLKHLVLLTVWGGRAAGRGREERERGRISLVPLTRSLEEELVEEVPTILWGEGGMGVQAVAWQKVEGSRFTKRNAASI